MFVGYLSVICRLFTALQVGLALWLRAEDATAGTDKVVSSWQAARVQSHGHGDSGHSVSFLPLTPEDSMTALRYDHSTACVCVFLC